MARRGVERAVSGIPPLDLDSVYFAMQPYLWPSALAMSSGRLHPMGGARQAGGTLAAHFPPARGLPPGWPIGKPPQPLRESTGDEGQGLRLTRLEAVLFLAKDPLSSRKLAALANLTDGSEARALVRALQTRYQAAGRAFQVEEVAGGFQILTLRRFSEWVRRHLQGKSPLGLSGPALETLAIVAFRQPVLRADVEAIRGVACDEILRQLMERELLRIVGRANELGRPILYGTTRRFLEVFGLKSLDDLPRSRQFARLGESHNRKPGTD